MSATLLAFSLLYRSAVSIRNKLYSAGLFKMHKAQIPVISVGNIVAGGVGKTPFTLLLAQYLLEQKINLAILSRGYGSKFEHKPRPTLISSPSGPLYDSEECGDEPYLLSSRLPKAHFFVGKNRVMSAQMAEKCGAEALLLDDGMQHRRLCRDLDILILDYKNPFGHGHLLPRGLLREPKSAISRANLIVINHVDTVENGLKLAEQIKPLSKAPVVMTQVSPIGFFDLNNNKIELPVRKKIAAFCGLAKPKYFYETLKAGGYELLLTQSYKDHQKADDNKLIEFANKAKALDVSTIVCTEKDAVKLKQTSNISLPIVQMKINLKIIYGQEDMKREINKLFYN